MQFQKSHAKYYHQWYRDCYDSAQYCDANGLICTAEHYRKEMKDYLEIILNNFEAIEFFSIGSNAFLKDSALPEEFRCYR